MKELEYTITLTGASSSTTMTTGEAVWLLQCDMTRVVSFMLDDARSDFVYNFMNERKITTTIKKISDKPIRFLVNTHVHGDHTGGVPLWKEAGTQVIAQREEVCAQRRTRLRSTLSRLRHLLHRRDEAPTLF